MSRLKNILSKGKDALLRTRNTLVKIKTKMEEAKNDVCGRRRTKKMVNASKKARATFEKLVKLRDKYKDVNIMGIDEEIKNLYDDYVSRK